MNDYAPWFHANPARFCRGLAGRSGLVAMLLFIWVIRSSGQEFDVRNWHFEDGLPDEEVTAIGQTPDGYLWVGTAKGLARFDGERFKIFNTESTPGLEDSRIANLMTDRAGTLWIGTLDGNLIRKKGDKFEPVQPPVPLAVDADKKRPPGSWLWGIHSELVADGEGSIWWHINDKGIARLKSGRWTVFTTTNGLPSGPLRQLVCDHEGRVWIEGNGLLYCFSNGRWVENRPGVLIGRELAVLAPAVTGGLWAAETKGSWYADGGLVHRLTNGWWQPSAGVIAPAQSYWTEVSSLCEDQTGHLWVGWYFGGLCYFDANGQRHDLNPHDSLAQQLVSVQCIFEDHQGNIWAGANSGLYRITPQMLTMLSPRPGTQRIHTTCATRDGAVWVGTETTGVFRFAGGKFTPVGGEWGILGVPLIYSLFQDSRSNLWAGTSIGLFRLQDGRFQRVSGPVPENWVLAIFEDREGCLWFGTRVGLFSWQKGVFTAYGPSVEIRSLAEDGVGNLWIGTMGSGLWRLPPGRQRTLSRVGNFPVSDARTLLCDRAGTLWVGGWGGGLFRYDGDTFQNFTTADGLPSDTIQSMSSDLNGRLWLSSNNGIIGFAPETLKNYVRGQSLPLLWLHLSSAQGLANRLCSGMGQPVATGTSDGRLWFPDMEQIAVFAPATALSQLTAPNVLVETVLAEGKEMSPAPGEALRITSGTRRFEISYTVADLTAPSNLRFCYQLEGMDRDWVDAGNRRVAYYSQLPPGEYKFRVMAGEQDGQWHEAAVPLRLQVVPRFWELRWVQLLAAMSFAAGSAVFILFNKQRQLQRRLKWTEMQNAVEQERIRIARDIHDDLGSSLTHIALLSELAQTDFDQPANARSHINEIFTTARRVARSVDEIVWAIDPKNDPLEMSLAYICKTAQDYLRAGGIICRLELPEELPARALSSTARHHLYLVVREALNNIIKHAAATEVQLRLSVESGHLLMIIADNGLGFTVPALSSGPAARVGHGLGNMVQRLEIVGGCFELESQPGRGTVIRLVLPLKPEVVPA
jgi:ligand-binding sensor domain-containing protein/signal transduction histidine kinase